MEVWSRSVLCPIGSVTVPAGASTRLHNPGFGHSLRPTRLVVCHDRHARFLVESFIFGETTLKDGDGFSSSLFSPESTVFFDMGVTAAPGTPIYLTLNNQTSAPWLVRAYLIGIVPASVSGQ
jgi:hypothetical protein